MFFLKYPKIIINLGNYYNNIFFIVPIILIFSSIEALLTSISLTTLFPIFNQIINDGNNSENFFFDFFNVDSNKLIIIFSLLIIFKALITILRKLLSISLSENLRTNLHTGITKSVLRMRFEIINSFKRGVLLENMSRNTDSTAMLLLRLTNLFTEVLMIIFLVITSLYLNWKITIFFIIIATILYFLIGKKYINISKVFGKQKVEEEQNLTHILSSYILNIKEIFLLNADNFFIRKVRDKSDLLKLIRIKNKFFAFIPKPLIEFGIGLLLLTFFLIFNDFEVFKKYLPSLILIFALSYKLFNSALNFTSELYKIENMIYAYENILKVFNLENKLNEDKKSEITRNKTFKKNIVFKKIYFSFNSRSGGQKVSVLKDFNFSIKKGSLSLIHGPSGSGKTTILDLLVKLYKPDSGSIEIDGKNINKIETTKIRNLIGYVTQNCSIFNADLIENIVLNNSVVDKKIKDIIDLCNLKKLQKVKNILIDGGKNLSGGEIKKIALARALYNEPEVLFIDETLTSIEETFELEVLNKLKLKGLTIVIISHRDSTMKLVDNIIYMNKKNSK
ncbi:MAG: hypothetical protein CMP41_01030 [Rickettsiales bacterium]|nr:hypothetical protein [Rickettsiales bacterium]